MQCSHLPCINETESPFQLLPQKREGQEGRNLLYHDRESANTNYIISNSVVVNSPLLQNMDELVIKRKTTQSGIAMSSLAIYICHLPNGPNIMSFYITMVEGNESISWWIKRKN